MRSESSSGMARTTRTAVLAYEEIKPHIAVLKAWEQVDTRHDETIAYELFDGTRLARRQDGRITTQTPRKTPIMIPLWWTRKALDDHIDRTVHVEGMTSLSDEDIDAYLRTGMLPGTARGRSYVDLEASLEHCTDAVRRRNAEYGGNAGWLRYVPRFETREEAWREVDRRFRNNQDGLLKNRIRYHMLGSRRGYSGIHRQVVHVMWRRMLDKDVALATMRAFGRSATVHDYNRVMAAWHLPCGRHGTGDRGLDALGSTHRSAFVFHRLMGPTSRRGSIADEIAGMPARLRTITGNARLWRATRDWTDPQLIPVARLVARTRLPRRARDHLPVDLALEALAHVVERRWPSTLLTSISWMSEEELRLITPFLPAMNAAATEARRRGRLKAFTASIPLVHDMLKNLDEDARATLMRDARNATWRRLEQRQAQWHIDRERMRRDDDEIDVTVRRSMDVSWSPLLGTYRDNGCEATEIVDAAGLAVEAREMMHCVDDYVLECLSGTSRIFSLRSGDERSTLELRRRDGTWHIRQNYGMENTRPAKSLIAFGRKVARIVNRANAATAEQERL